MSIARSRVLDDAGRIGKIEYDRVGRGLTHNAQSRVDDGNSAQGIGETARPNSLFSRQTQRLGEGFIASARLKPAHTYLVKHIIGTPQAGAQIRRGFNGD